MTTSSLLSYNLVINNGDFRIADFKNYHSLIPLAQEAQKPVFELTNKDGVIGAHYRYVQSCDEEFTNIANKIISLIV